MVMLNKSGWSIVTQSASRLLSENPPMVIGINNDLSIEILFDGSPVIGDPNLLVQQCLPSVTFYEHRHLPLFCLLQFFILNLFFSVLVCS